MKFETRKLSAPSKGRGGDKALEITVRRPESWADCVELCAGSEERALDVFQSGYVVKVQTIRDGEPGLKPDGSTDEIVLDQAKTFEVTGQRGGGPRGPSANTLLAKAEKSGKKTFTLAEMKALIEEQKAAKK